MLRAGLEAGLEVGTEIQGDQGVYRIEGVLRATAQMSTYQAQETLTGYPVVLKVLCVARLENWKGLELFERETGVLRQLDHPALPVYLDSFARETEAGPRLYLVMSWKEGLSLLERFEAGWRPDERVLRDLAVQTLETLAYLQGFNPPIIHRDLKPGNLILDDEGKLHLVDFGAVQGVLNPDGGSTVVGTFGYMPPEQFSDRCVPASDLYALGATLVHLLTGKYPSDLPREGLKLAYRKALEQDLEGRPGVSPGFLAWLDRLLLPSPEHRFVSAAQALAALELEAIGSGGESAQAKGLPDRIQSTRRGPQQTILIAPLPWLPGVVTPLLATSLRLGLAWLLLSACLSGLDDYQQALWGDFLPRMFGFAWLYAVASHLLHGRTRTSLSLQPDRIEILHAWGPLKRRIRGTPTQFLNVRRRFSLLRMVWICQFVDWSGLKHTAGLHLAAHECRRLASLLHVYMRDLDPGLAASFAAAAFSGPRQQTPNEWRILGMSYAAACADFRPASRAFGKHALMPGLIPCLMPATQYLKRFETRQLGQGLQIRISKRYPYTWGALLLLVWLPLTAMSLLNVWHDFFLGLQQISWRMDHFPLIGCLPETSGYACLSVLSRLDPKAVILNLILLLSAGFWLRRIMGAIRAAVAGIALQVDATGLRILSQDEKGEREVRIHPAQMLDLAIVTGWGPRRGELVLATLDGGLHTLSRGLSRFENLALIADLCTHLARSDALLTPAFRSCLMQWRPELDWQRHYWRGIPVGRVRFGPEDERPWRSLIEIRPHGVTGVLVWMLWLSLALSSFGLFQIHDFDAEMAFQRFGSLSEFAAFTAETMSHSGNPFRRPMRPVQDTSEPEIEPPFMGCFHDEYYEQLIMREQEALIRQQRYLAWIAALEVYSKEDLIYPQGLVWGSLGLVTGLLLLVWVCFYARVRTRLRLEGDQLTVTTRCFGLQRRQKLNLSRVVAYQQPDLAGGSHRLFFVQNRRRVEAGFHLTLGEVQELSERLLAERERLLLRQQAAGLDMKPANLPGRAPVHSLPLGLRYRRTLVMPSIQPYKSQRQESQEVKV